MSGNDRVNFSTREQLLSTDVNENSRIAARLPLDSLLYLRSAYTPPGGSEEVLPVVIGGLQAQGEASGVTISRGMLAQAWPGTGTAPGADDSPLVMGRANVSVNVAIPVPGSDTYYLVQARATETPTISAGRNVWDEVSQSFVPTALTTKIENTLEFLVSAGTTTDLPLPTDGYVPICGVLRRATGAAPLASEIYDLRPLRHEAGLGDDILDTQLQTEPVVPITRLSRFQFQARQDRAGRCHVSSLGQYVDVLDAVYRDPTTVIATNTWYYLYLATWGGTLPSGQYADLRARGVFVCSSTPPGEQGDNVTEGGLTLPPPFSNDTAARAICVGMVKINNFATELVQADIANRKVTLNSVVAVSDPGGGIAIPAHYIARNARRGYVIIDTSDGTNVQVGNTGLPPACQFTRDPALASFTSVHPCELVGFDTTTFININGNGLGFQSFDY